LASLGPRNVYKDMLDNMVSPIDHVVMNHQNHTRTNGIRGHVRYSTTFIYYINQSTSLQLMLGTSPSGLNQTKRNRLASASCKRKRLHICRQLERRKSSNHPICRCRSHTPALCQRHQDLPDKRVGHVSFPTKKQKRCIFYYAGYNPTLAVEGLSKAAKQHSR
jgi:hypothetical protein